jgi:hypothetical protein
MGYTATNMGYTAIIEARKDAEAKQENVREAVRRGLQMKRREEERKMAQRQERASANADG